MRAALLLLAWGAAPVSAIDRIELAADSIAVMGAQFTTLRAALVITDGQHSVATIDAAALHSSALAPQTGALTALRVRARAQSRSGNTTFSGTGPTLAGAQLAWNGALTSRGWRIRTSLPTVTLDALQSLARRWIAVPKAVADLKPTGGISLAADLQGRDATLTRADVSLAFTNVNFTNTESTLIAEKLAARFDVQTSGDLAHAAASITLKGTAGQVLAGPVLLDFNVNALQVDADVRLAEGMVTVPRIAFAQQALAHGTGNATLVLSPFSVREARVDLESLQFPAAYTSFLQIPLTTTAFGGLTVSGNAHGSLMLRDDAPLRADFVLRDIALRDPAKRINVVGLNGTLRWWSGTQEGPPGPSYLEWREATLFGIEGGAARLDFLAHDLDFEFLKPARLPIFDGSILIEKLVARGIGKDDMQGAFAAQIEPISMARITRAFGWPEFQGQISGRVPGLEYRDQLLTLGGNLEAKVFDGSIVASKLRVRDPLGQWPRLYGDIVARNLDLDQITSTFEFGGITGRLDADVLGLETFNWSPTAFDARLATPKNDKSAHRISQKAVNNLSNIGGGGGGVTAALQSGFLRFFDTFHYDRLGFSCRLQNDVCLMDGVEPANSGYYIVKGSGIPRIDIIGNSRRVDWPTLMAQLVAGMNTENIVVK